MKRFNSVAGTIILVVMLVNSNWASASRTSLTVFFDEEQQTLTLEAENASFKTILEEIGKVTGVVFYVFGDQSGLINYSFNNIPLEKGVGQLAKSYSVAAVYSTGEGDSATTVKEIWLIRQNRSAVHAVEDDETIEGQYVDSSASVNRSGNTGYDTDEKLIAAEDFVVSAESGALNIHLDDEGTDVGRLTRRLLGVEDYDEKSKSLEELQRIGSDEALGAISVALGDSDERVRKQAVDNLKLMGNSGVPQILGQALLGDDDVSVRRAALEYFSGRSDQVSQAFLTTALNDKSDLIRYLAGKALE